MTVFTPEPGTLLARWNSAKRTLSKIGFHRVNLCNLRNLRTTLTFACPVKCFAETERSGLVRLWSI
jgi:hypothetical protein